MDSIRKMQSNKLVTLHKQDSYTFHMHKSAQSELQTGTCTGSINNEIKSETMIKLLLAKPDCCFHVHS